jgi:hypothetical protein
MAAFVVGGGISVNVVFSGWRTAFRLAMTVQEAASLTTNH